MEKSKVLLTNRFFEENRALAEDIRLLGEQDKERIYVVYAKGAETAPVNVAAFTQKDRAEALVKKLDEKYQMFHIGIEEITHSF